VLGNTIKLKSYIKQKVVRTKDTLLQKIFMKGGKSQTNPIGMVEIGELQSIVES
jgi:hypothetical protein